MPQPVTTIKVSNRGQLSLPAPARHRWNLGAGGELGALDLGDAVLLIPGGAEAARLALADAVADGRYQSAVDEIEDPELQDQ